MTSEHVALSGTGAAGLAAADRSAYALSPNGAAAQAAPHATATNRAQLSVSAPQPQQGTTPSSVQCTTQGPTSMPDREGGQCAAAGEPAHSLADMRTARRASAAAVCGPLQHGDRCGVAERGGPALQAAASQQAPAGLLAVDGSDAEVASAAPVLQLQADTASNAELAPTAPLACAADGHPLSQQEPAADAGDQTGSDARDSHPARVYSSHEALCRIVDFLSSRILALQYDQRDEDKELIEAAAAGAKSAESALEDVGGESGPSDSRAHSACVEEFDAAVERLASTIAQLMQRWQQTRGCGGGVADLYIQLWKGVRRAHAQDLLASGVVQSVNKRSSRWAADKGEQPLNKHAEIKARAQVELATIANGVHRQTGVDCFVMLYDESRRKVSVLTSGRLTGLAKAMHLDEVAHHYIGLQRNLRAMRGFCDTPLAQSSFEDLHISLQRKCVMTLSNIFEPEGKRQQEHPFNKGVPSNIAAIFASPGYIGRVNDELQTVELKI